MSSAMAAAPRPPVSDRISARATADLDGALLTFRGPRQLRPRPRLQRIRRAHRFRTATMRRARHVRSARPARSAPASTRCRRSGRRSTRAPAAGAAGAAAYSRPGHAPGRAARAASRAQGPALRARPQPVPARGAGGTHAPRRWFRPTARAVATTPRHAVRPGRQPRAGCAGRPSLELACSAPRPLRRAPCATKVSADRAQTQRADDQEQACPADCAPPGRLASTVWLVVACPNATRSPRGVARAVERPLILLSRPTAAPQTDARAARRL